MKWVHGGECRVIQNSYFCILDGQLFQAAVKQFKDVIGSLCCEYATSFVNFLRVTDQKDVLDLISGVSHEFSTLGRSGSTTSSKTKRLHKTSSRSLAGSIVGRRTSENNRAGSMPVGDLI